MKINPIRNYGSLYSLKPQKANVNKYITNLNSENYTGVNYENFYNINFNAAPNIDKSISFFVKTSSLQDKLTVALDKLEPNCILFIGKSKQQILKTFENDRKNVVGFLRKLYLLTDSKINEFLAVSKDEYGCLYFQNMGKEPILFSSIEHRNDNVIEYLRKNKQIIMSPDDILILGDDWVTVKYDEKKEELSKLKEYSNMFIKEYDFTEDIERFATAQNNKVLEVLGNESAKRNPLTFSDVGGQDEVIKNLKRFVLFPMKYPKAFKGFMVNRGVVLYGPPGTGKSLIAEALTNEANASCFKLSGSELESKWVGESEKNCRELFAKAIDAQPSIIYIDEFDALGKERNGKDVHGDKLLNQLLASMSQIEKSNDNVFIIAATNKLDTLDPAIVRSGRFGQQYEVKLPDLEGTEQIFGIHLKGKPISKTLDKKSLVKAAYDKKMSGADIAALVNSAYIHALDRTGIYESMDSGRFSNGMLDHFKIENEDFLAAIDDMKSVGHNKIGF